MLTRVPPSQGFVDAPRDEGLATAWQLKTVIDIVGAFVHPIGEMPGLDWDWKQEHVGDDDDDEEEEDDDEEDEEDHGKSGKKGSPRDDWERFHTLLTSVIANAPRCITGALGAAELAAFTISLPPVVAVGTPLAALASLDLTSLLPMAKPATYGDVATLTTRTDAAVRLAHGADDDDDDDQHEALVLFRRRRGRATTITTVECSGELCRHPD
jgi:hypothetical protein